MKNSLFCRKNNRYAKAAPAILTGAVLLAAVPVYHPFAPPAALASGKQQQRLGEADNPSSSVSSPTPSSSPSASSSSMPGKPPATGSRDPAYEAFEEGRYLTALKLAMQQAGKGEPQAFTLIGRIHAEGLGVPRDLVKAAQWYAGGAERGDRDSQFALALQLVQGQGIRRDAKQAADLFNAAAIQGHSQAQYNLGLLYAAGNGRPEDMTRAAFWFEKAARQGVARAQYDLGSLYRAGAGIKQDKAKAAYWTGQAASAGLTEAELEYGLMLFLGKGIEKNQKEGAALLLKAAMKGNPVAQNRVARLYAHGIVFKRNLVEARKWHLLARQRGVSDLDLDVRLARLPRQKLEQARAAARQWQQKNIAP